MKFGLEKTTTTQVNSRINLNITKIFEKRKKMSKTKNRQWNGKKYKWAFECARARQLAMSSARFIVALLCTISLLLLLFFSFILSHVIDSPSVDFFHAELTVLVRNSKTNGFSGFFLSFFFTLCVNFSCHCDRTLSFSFQHIRTFCILHGCVHFFPSKQFQLIVDTGRIKTTDFTHDKNDDKKRHATK